MEGHPEKEIARKRLQLSLIIPLLFIAWLWLIYLFEISSGIDLSFLGVTPRTLFGLTGILFAPLLHGGFDHLLSNSIPLFILGAALIYFYRTLAYRVFAAVWIFDGIGVWLMGREAVHIGASGVVYGMASFLFFSGTLRRNRALAILSLIVVFLYGSLIWGMFPYDPDISWEAHWVGFLSGIVLSVLFRKEGPPDDVQPDWMQTDEDDEQDAAHSERKEMTDQIISEDNPTGEFKL
jgi:membrane associated rhomboid family serine protease